MAMSGVTADATCQKAFEELNLKKKHRFVIFAIKDKKTIFVAKTGNPEKSYEDFLKSLSPKNPCYALVDVDYQSKSGKTTSKPVLIFWSPDACTNVFEKTLYASSQGALRKICQGIQCEVQGTEIDDLKKKEVQEKLQKLK